MTKCQARFIQECKSPSDRNLIYDFKKGGMVKGKNGYLNDVNQVPEPVLGIDLITRDISRYQTYFPTLKLISP